MLGVGIGVLVLVLLLATGICQSLRLAQALDKIDMLNSRLQNRKALNEQYRKTTTELTDALTAQQDANNALVRLLEIKDKLLAGATSADALDVSKEAE